MADRDLRLLKDIRDRLADLPSRLASVLRRSPEELGLRSRLGEDRPRHEIRPRAPLFEAGSRLLSAGRTGGLEGTIRELIEVLRGRVREERQASVERPSPKAAPTLGDEQKRGILGAVRRQAVFADLRPTPKREQPAPPVPLAEATPRRGFEVAAPGRTLGKVERPDLEKPTGPARPVPFGLASQTQTPAPRPASPPMRLPYPLEWQPPQKPAPPTYRLGSAYEFPGVSKPVPTRRYRLAHEEETTGEEAPQRPSPRKMRRGYGLGEEGLPLAAPPAIRPVGSGAMSGPGPADAIGKLEKAAEKLERAAEKLSKGDGDDDETEHGGQLPEHDRGGRLPKAPEHDRGGSEEHEIPEQPGALRTPIGGLGAGRSGARGAARRGINVLRRLIGM